jgi:Fe-S-cluster-containing dehydrogenase component/formate-dependent nitrite reductase membrane component NrfD
VAAASAEPGADRPVLWAKVLDQERCIGCHACTVACKAEHEVAVGVTRTFVKQVEIGEFPMVRRQFQVTRCNQCSDPPCVAACPVSAMFQRPDGIVDFDRELCIGCKACIAACPYDAIFIDPVSHSAEKCNFCAHRIDQGLQPACVAVCPEGAIVIGDLNDPESEVSRIVARERVAVRRPQAGTGPKVFYKGADVASLDPLRAEAPRMFYATEVRGGARAAAPRPAAGTARNAARALLAYDGQHPVPWDARVSLYTWTKSVAAGLFGVGGLCAVGTGRGAGLLPLLAGLSLAFLLLTLGLVVGDLEHPERFYRILLRPQPRSWLARGAFLMTAYAVFLAAVAAAGLAGAGVAAGLGVPGAVLAALAAVYTAFMFAQCRGRDLWQSPTLPLALLVQAAVAGAGTLVALGAVAHLPGAWVGPLATTLTASLAAHLVLLLVDLAMPPPTQEGRAAAAVLRRGAFAAWYWSGFAAAAAALALAAAGGPPLAAALVAVLGLLPYQHAFVQAGQSVPQS